MATSPFNPSMLAFTRSLETTEALMFGSTGKGDDAVVEPVEVTTTGQRGQSSHEALNRDKAGASKAGKSNPQEVEIARMPAGCIRLIIQCGLRVMPNSLKPSATDSLEAVKAYGDLAARFGAHGGYEMLAARYIENIANGAFAWRNRGLSDEAFVEVIFDGKVVRFDPFALDVDAILGLEAVKAALVLGDASDVDALVAHFADGLSREPKAISFSWNGHVLPNSEVYPSQEYKYSKDAKAKDVPSRLLASVRGRRGTESIRQASMHSQKIGAALRRIDDWHDDAFYGPIPVNAFGGVQEAGIALRHGNKAAPSFWDLIKKPSLFLDDLEKGVVSDNAQFTIAMLVRGGVYGNGKD